MTDVQVESGLTKTKAKTKKREHIDFDEAVTEGKQLVKTIKSNQMRLGELADRLKPVYGDKTLERFAKEIGVKAATVERWRSTYRSRKGKPATEPAVQGKPAPEPVSASVFKALQGLPQPVQDKIIEEHLKQYPKLSKRQADTYARDYRAAHPEIQEDWRVSETRRYLDEVTKFTRQGIKYGHPSQQHLDPIILRQALDNPEQTLATWRACARGVNNLADEVERALASPTPPPMFDDAPGLSSR